MPLRVERAPDSVFIQPTKNPLSIAALEAAKKLLRIAEQLLPA